MCLLPIGSLTIPAVFNSSLKVHHQFKCAIEVRRSDLHRKIHLHHFKIWREHIMIFCGEFQIKVSRRKCIESASAFDVIQPDPVREVAIDMRSHASKAGREADVFHCSFLAMTGFCCYQGEMTSRSHEQGDIKWVLLT